MRLIIKITIVCLIVLSTNIYSQLRDFDFAVGDWEVSNNSGGSGACSVTSNLFNIVFLLSASITNYTQEIAESNMMCLISYQPYEKVWKFTWLEDARNLHIETIGGWSGEEMIFEYIATGSEDISRKITLKPISDSQILFSENFSSDLGDNWQPLTQFTFSKSGNSQNLKNIPNEKIYDKSSLKTTNTEFDFILGDWGLQHSGSGGGRSLFEPILDGTAIKETTVLTGLAVGNISGFSLISFTEESQQWNLTWADHNGAHFTAKGTFESGIMTLITDRFHRNNQFLHKLTYKPISNNENYYLETFSYDDGNSWVFPWSVTYILRNVTHVNDDQNLLENFALYQNYPNPFNPSTVISWQLVKGSKVTLKVYDQLGREIKTLVEGYKKPGHYETTFNNDLLPSGAYIYKLTSGGKSISKKMILIK